MPLCSGSIPIAVDHVRRDLGLEVVAPRPTDPGELFDDVGDVLHLRRVREIAALLRTHPLVGIPHSRRPASLSLWRCQLHGHTVHIDAAARL